MDDKAKFIASPTIAFMRLALAMLVSTLACWTAVAKPPLVNPWAPHKAAPQQLYSQHDVVVPKQCGGAEMRLVCPPRSKENPFGCLQTRLMLTAADGKQSEIARPKEIADENFTAVGLACAKAKNDSSYFVVQYGQQPFSCQMCELLYLYDDKGRALTKSGPLLLRDESLPGPKKWRPNNLEFDRRSDALELGKFDFDYLTCDVWSDDAGNVACLMKL